MSLRGNCRRRRNVYAKLSNLRRMRSWSPTRRNLMTTETSGKAFKDVSKNSPKIGYRGAMISITNQYGRLRNDTLKMSVLTMRRVEIIKLAYKALEFRDKLILEDSQ